MRTLLRSLPLAILSIGLLLIGTSSSVAKVRRTTLGPGSGASLALDPQQRPHVSYQGTDDQLHHSWLDGSRWADEVIDASSGSASSGSYSDIAVDSQGRVHISYHAQFLGEQVLRYAVFESGAWQTTEVGEGGVTTAIALGPTEQPRILHYGPFGGLRYSTYDGAAWDTEATGGLGGLHFFPTGLAVDSLDTPHITFTSRISTDDIATYATESGGTWAGTELASQTGGHLTAAIALDSLDQPHAAITLGQTVQHRHFDSGEGEWLTEEVFSSPPGEVTLFPDYVALALDHDDRPHILFSIFVSVGDRGAEALLYTFFDGVDWRLLFIEKNAGPGISVAVDDQRVVHGTYHAGRGEDRSKSRYVRITLPDITGTWTSSTLTEAGGNTTVEALLTIGNDGSDTAKSAPVALFLSDDAVLDQVDERLSLKRKTGGVKPGASKALPISFEHVGSLDGRYLIAVIDPDKERDDLDRLNNTIVVQLGP